MEKSTELSKKPKAEKEQNTEGQQVNRGDQGQALEKNTQTTYPRFSGFDGF